VIAQTRSIDDVNEAIAEVLSGHVPARLVFEYAAVPATV
jgi:propanol-preferring alcohol dehydrogenase